jgi:hypothetical protein
VHPGELLGEFCVGGRNVLVLICADFFWLSSLLLHAVQPPDVILVAALSVTRKSSPTYSKEIWRHTAVARAYERAAFVGISDWAFPSSLPGFFSSGVGGFADPTVTEPASLFRPMGEQQVSAFPLDFEALAAFRADRATRGFLPLSTEPSV